MLASASSLLIPLALTSGLGASTPSLALHHDVRAYVTGYNTVPGQTDSTPCIAASGADICGRHDAVACPRRISLGTTVEIGGTTYVCEDRLAKKFDDRFDISCDKDTTCPLQVTGWATIKVYAEEHPLPPAPATMVAVSSTPGQQPVVSRTAAIKAAAIKTAANDRILVFPGRAIAVLDRIAHAPTAATPATAVATTVARAPTTVARRVTKLASLAKSALALRGHG